MFFLGGFLLSGLFSFHLWKISSPCWKTLNSLRMKSFFEDFFSCDGFGAHFSFSPLFGLESFSFSAYTGSSLGIFLLSPGMKEKSVSLEFLIFFYLQTCCLLISCLLLMLKVWGCHLSGGLVIWRRHKMDTELDNNHIINDCSLSYV